MDIYLNKQYVAYNLLRESIILFAQGNRNLDLVIYNNAFTVFNLIEELKRKGLKVDLPYKLDKEKIFESQGNINDSLWNFMKHGEKAREVRHISGDWIYHENAHLLDCCCRDYLKFFNNIDYTAETLKPGYIEDNQFSELNMNYIVFKIYHTWFAYHYREKDKNLYNMMCEQSPKDIIGNIHKIKALDLVLKHYKIMK
ncbi:MAG: hypothetical protein GY793_11220 [Proteobacteria bacterium]|nr:hypothetical protein [Pseudomonadota bacterium]